MEKLESMQEYIFWLEREFQIEKRLLRKTAIAIEIIKKKRVLKKRTI